MNHPTREEWVPYVCGELGAINRRRLKQHLKACPECRSEVRAWECSLRRLDSWRLPAAKPANQTLAPFLRWGVAVLVVLAAGIGIGHSMAAKNNLERARAALEPQIRQHLRQEFAAMLQQELAKSASLTLVTARDQARSIVAESAANLETRRLEENQAIYSALDRLFVSLKKDVDTVALNTDESLRQLAQSANGDLPADSPQP